MLIIKMKDGETYFYHGYYNDLRLFFEKCLEGKIDIINCEDCYGNKAIIRTSEISHIRESYRTLSELIKKEKRKYTQEDIDKFSKELREKEEKEYQEYLNRLEKERLEDTNTKWDMD